MNASNAAVAFDPGTYRGEAALVLVLAPSERSPAFETQMDLLAEAADDLRRRGVVVARLLFEGVSRVGDRRIDEASARALRARYDVGDDDFRLVLLDVDGREVRRDDAPLQPEAILDALTPRA